MMPSQSTGGSGGDDGRKRKREDEDRPNGGGSEGKTPEEIAAEVVPLATNRVRVIAARRRSTAEYPAVDALRALAENRPPPRRTPEQQQAQDDYLRRMRRSSRREDRRREDLYTDFSNAFDNCRDFTFRDASYKHLQRGADFDQTTSDFFSAWSPEGWLRDQPRDQFELVRSTRNSGVDFTIHFLPGRNPRYSIAGNCEGNTVTVFHIGPVQ